MEDSGPCWIPPCTEETLTNGWRLRDLAMLLSDSGIGYNYESYRCSECASAYSLVATSS